MISVISITKLIGGIVLLINAGWWLAIGGHPVLFVMSAFVAVMMLYTCVVRIDMDDLDRDDDDDQPLTA